MLRFRLAGRYGLVGFVFFLVIVAAASGGCADTASSPIEEGERERGIEEAAEPKPAEPREEPKPPKTETEIPRKEAEAAPPPAPAAPEPEPPAPTVAASDPDDGEGVQYESGTSAAHDATATVRRVVDGDTVEISPAIDGITGVRLIGVDTPETKEPGCAPQPYGPEASSYAESVLSGQQVELEFDAEKTDRYGRLLAYVYPEGGEMFNEDLLEGGYAQAYPYPPNTRYAERFAAAQEGARAAGLGIWSLGPDQLALLTDRGNGIGAEGCAPLSPQPEPEPVPQYQAPAASPALVPYPDVPSVPSAPSAGGDLDCKDFGSLAEVQASIAAGDPHGLDADGDGSGCESQF
ncbi:MAG: thermonuclease family protein [Actinomycetota bacterium]|nr:thermonuclease family protein [Actinomycetota bacterium]